MRMFSEPESWLGLRSERTVAGEFAAPLSPRAMPPRPKLDTAPTLSLQGGRSVMRRALAILIGR
jgi:hypothetical protein